MPNETTVRSRVHVTLPDGTVVGEHGSRAIAERAINRVYAVRHHGPFEVREGPAPKTARWV